DEDREGEAIAWHLLEELKPKVPHSRMVFHEITPEAIARAIANPQKLDQGKVNAYQARRVLDRLYGYEVSPVLWKKVMPKLSGGRVQSVATRLVVDRERERIAFRTGARPTRRSGPPRCSRRPRASWASRPSTRCRSRSGCTRTATSPICAPTR